MDESNNEAILLLNSLKSSDYAQLFVDQAKKVLELAGSEIRKEFVENFGTESHIHDIRGIPRTTQQQILCLSRNKGDIAGAKKLLNVIFRYDKNVFYDFIKFLINNNQSELFTKLFSEVQQQNHLFSNFRITNQTSSSIRSCSFMSQPINPVDRLLVNNPSGSYSSSYSPSGRSEQSRNSQFYSTLLEVDRINSDQNRSTISISSNDQMISISEPADFDIRELNELRSLRRQVTDFFGSVENFRSSLAVHSLRGNRAIQENNDNLEPGAFTTMDYNATEQQ